jgi:hypothetical protein
VVSHSTFFTEAGIEARNQKIKMKVLMQQERSKSANEEKENNQQNAEVENYLKVLQLHNVETARIRLKYINAKNGVDTKDEAEPDKPTELSQAPESESKPAKKGKKKSKKKKPAAQEFVIKMKDKDGNVINFDADDIPELEETTEEAKVGTEQDPTKKTGKPKKKKIRLECENVMEALSTKA